MSVTGKLDSFIICRVSATELIPTFILKYLLSNIKNRRPGSMIYVEDEGQPGWIWLDGLSIRYWTYRFGDWQLSSSGPGPGQVKVSRRSGRSESSLNQVNLNVKDFNENLMKTLFLDLARMLGWVDMSQVWSEGTELHGWLGGGHQEGLQGALKGGHVRVHQGVKNCLMDSGQDIIIVGFIFTVIRLVTIIVHWHNNIINCTHNHNHGRVSMSQLWSRLV